ncbi:hypothetical protein BGW36DRAFT_431829 [Talaromyces proteolyticus]|uniref:Uncharacterized protein n=1 Tax=Talaromyces proteolyticus TaxID=1131652 RepID=A0AAD4KKD8_9EURO|nr:uncharacterized protein BGW36DRAFT_431829 [Talaromyces proteolyticus]KAH8691276.1 hypothetical protein BGW36DRAFT_431829 [Talaromyces proteolyticus]
MAESNLIAVSVLTSVSVGFVAARMGTRIWLLRKVGVDDYLIILASFFALCYMSLSIAG